MQRQNPPGPTGFKAVRNIVRQLAGDRDISRYTEAWKAYGDISYSKLGPLDAYLLANPKDIHHVLVKNQKNYIKGIVYDGFRLVVGLGLVTSDGELWRKQRRLLQPPFTVTAIQSFTAMMADITQQMVQRWETLAGTGELVHIDDEMMRLTTSVIGQALFEVDLTKELTEVGYAFQDAFAFVPERSMTPFKFPLSWPIPKYRRFNNSMALIDQFVADRVAEKRKQGPDDSLLSALLEAKDKQTGYQMDEKQLRDEIVTLFFAGFETTARSLSWLWYLLSRHQDVADKVAAEAKEVLNGRLPTIGDLYQLTYARMVVDEVLRMYPPVAVMPRQNIEDDEIGGYRVPAGSLVMSLTYIAHHHPDYWERPYAFDPERFAPEVAQTRPKYAYVPFANGQRVCLGNNFALLEMVLACAMAMERFQLRAPSDEPIPAKFSGTTSPSRPIMLYIEPRTK